MVLVDPRIGSRELLSEIRQHGVKAELAPLEYGDCALEGNGPDGIITVGVERKKLADILFCIDDSRFSAHQMPGMRMLYTVSVLIVEGHWKPHEDGTLYEGFQGGTSWGPCKYRSQRVLYSKLRRYLFSIAISGVIVLQTRDLSHTAHDICELHGYFAKKWDQHTSLIECQKLAIPTLERKPSLVRRWASELEQVGVKKSVEAERIFKRPIILAKASEVDWMKIDGVGVATAQRIVREIWG